MSLLVGIMVDNSLLAINETLGVIFNNDSAWYGVSDETVAIRKAVTVEEMLTMTTGLVTPAYWNSMAALTDPNNPWGGSSLSNSLAYPDIGPKGEFSYLPVGNIFSYVVKERTGMSPREYLAQNVMTHLGIIESAYNWGTKRGRHGVFVSWSRVDSFSNGKVRTAVPTRWAHRTCQ